MIAGCSYPVLVVAGDSTTRSVVGAPGGPCSVTGIHFNGTVCVN
jgi:hypothetical protein